MKNRQTPKSVRVDNNARKYDVERARRWMYEDGTTIDSAAMKQLLGPKSQTPTRVRHSFVVHSCKMG